MTTQSCLFPFTDSPLNVTLSVVNDGRFKAAQFRRADSPGFVANPTHARPIGANETPQVGKAGSAVGRRL